jgi:hypothetical protein
MRVQYTKGTSDSSSLPAGRAFHGQIKDSKRGHGSNWTSIAMRPRIRDFSSHCEISLSPIGINLSKDVGRGIRCIKGCASEFSSVPRLPST